ncbi:MAG: hypothetical protein ABIF01_03025, partial [Candidatus Micrarchaeota archaeon]
MKKKTEKTDKPAENVASDAQQAAPVHAPKKKERKSRKKKEKFFHARGKRKESIARATITEG